MTQSQYKRNMTLRFEKNVPIPQKGDTVWMQSFFGPIFYMVHITQIRKQEQLPGDGATLLTVDARVKLVQPAEEKRQFVNGGISSR